MTTEIMKKDESPFQVTNFDQAMKFAEIFASSDLAPKDFKGKPGNVFVAMQMGHEIGLKPMQALQNIAVVNGRPQIWGDAALALVRSHKDCMGIKEWIEGDMSQKTAIAFCEVKRGSEIITRSFSVAQSVKAGLFGKAVWQQYPERMLAMRARGFALRDSFPDVLKGVYVEGEMDDVKTGKIELSVVSDRVKNLIENKNSSKRITATMGSFEILEGSIAIDINNNYDTDKYLASKITVEPNCPIDEFIEEEIDNVIPIDEIDSILLDEVFEDTKTDFESVKNKILNSKTVEELIYAKDIAKSIVSSDEEREEIKKIFNTMKEKVK